MRLDLRHQIVERLRGVGGAGALGQRKIAKLRRAERQIEARPPRSAVRPAPAPPTARRNLTFDCAGGSRSAVRGGQQAAADFDPRGLRFRRRRSGRRRRRDRSRRAGPCRRRLRCRRPAAARARPSGQSTAKIAAAVISANTNHSVIKQVPGRNGAFTEAPMRRFTPPAASPAIDNSAAKPENACEVAE